MSRRMWAGLGLVAAGIGGLVMSRSIGSRPETTAPGPVPACPDMPNCARVAVPLAAPVDEVLAAARSALFDTDLDSFSETDAGATAVARIGPFRDDLAIAVEAADEGAVLWVRSASRVGRSDLGVNARRVDHIVGAVRQRLSETEDER